jgi:hypothetical protein
VRVLLQITADDGEPGSVEEIAVWDKTATVAEDIGLFLADGKKLLSAAQRRIVEAQTTAWVEDRRCCENCGRRATAKGRYDRKPKRRPIDVLESQGVQANQDITFLTDGSKEILACRRFRRATGLALMAGLRPAGARNLAPRCPIRRWPLRGAPRVDPLE